MATYTEALQEAYASAPDNVVILDTLELRHPSFVDEMDNPIAVRIVSDHQDLLATLEADAPLNPSEEVTFTALAFECALPEQTDSNSLPEITIAVDNIGSELTSLLDLASTSAAPVEITYRPYLSTDTSAPHMNPVLTLTLRGAEVTPTKVTARATFGDLVNRRFPSLRYTKANFPTLAAS